MYSSAGILGRKQQQRGWSWRVFRIPFGSVRRRQRLFRFLIACLVFVAVVPPLFFHFRLRSFRQGQLRKCSWMNDPPLVCAHGGDSTNALANTMAAYQAALRSQVDCIEIDISRSSDGVLLALHDRDIQRISGDGTSKVGHFSLKEIKELKTAHQSANMSDDAKVSTIEEALKLISRSVREVILDAKVGPPSFENGLANDILSAIEQTECRNCVVWAKSDSLVRDIITQSSNVPVGYIVMKDPSTGRRNLLFRIKGADIVGAYHPLIDEKMVTNLHRKKQKVYAWTVDHDESMRKMLALKVDAIVTSNPTLLQRIMQDIRVQCLEEGYTL